MAETVKAPALKLQSAHKTVGWLNSVGPVAVMASSACGDPNCGCHQAIREGNRKKPEEE